MFSTQRLVLAAVVAFCGTVGAQAGFWQDVWQGLDYLATPSGYPVFGTGDGTLVNGARSGRLRIMPNNFGGGYRVEFDRSFGADSRGRQEVFHLGPAGQLTLQGSLQGTAGYVGEDYRLLQGTFVANNLNYELRSQLGAQDVAYRGTFNLGANIEINPFGFYSIAYDISNTNGEVEVDGVLVRDDDETNFDIGPVSVEGNLYVDAAVVLLSALGLDTSGLEGLFPDSPVDQINNIVDQELQEVGLVAGETSEAGLLTQTLLTGDAAAADALMQAALADVDLGALSERPVDGEVAGGGPVRSVPEPSALLLLVIGGAGVSAACRRQRG